MQFRDVVEYALFDHDANIARQTSKPDWKTEGCLDAWRLQPSGHLLLCDP